MDDGTLPHLSTSRQNAAEGAVLAIGADMEVRELTRQATRKEKHAAAASTASRGCHFTYRHRPRRRLVCGDPADPNPFNAAVYFDPYSEHCRHDRTRVEVSPAAMRGTAAGAAVVLPNPSAALEPLSSAMARPANPPSAFGSEAGVSDDFGADVHSYSTSSNASRGKVEPASSTSSVALTALEGTLARVERGEEQLPALTCAVKRFRRKAGPAAHSKDARRVLRRAHARMAEILDTEEPTSMHRAASTAIVLVATHDKSEAAAQLQLPPPRATDMVASKNVATADSEAKQQYHSPHEAPSAEELQNSQDEKTEFSFKDALARTKAQLATMDLDTTKTELGAKTELAAIEWPKRRKNLYDYYKDKGVCTAMNKTIEHKEPQKLCPHAQGAGLHVQLFEDSDRPNLPLWNSKSLPRILCPICHSLMIKTAIKVDAIRLGRAITAAAFAAERDEYSKSWAKTATIQLIHPSIATAPGGPAADAPIHDDAAVHDRDATPRSGSDSARSSASQASRSSPAPPSPFASDAGSDSAADASAEQQVQPVEIMRGDIPVPRREQSTDAAADDTGLEQAFQEYGGSQQDDTSDGSAVTEAGMDDATKVDDDEAEEKFKSDMSSLLGALRALSAWGFSSEGEIANMTDDEVRRALPGDEYATMSAKKMREKLNEFVAASNSNCLSPQSQSQSQIEHKEKEKGKGEV